MIFEKKFSFVAKGVLKKQIGVRLWNENHDIQVNQFWINQNYKNKRELQI